MRTEQLRNYLHERVALWRRQTPREFIPILLEALQAQDRQQQRELLQHHLGATLKELLQVPFVSYATDIRPELDGLGLFDDRYVFASLRERCQRAVSAFADHQGWRQRRQRQHAQRFQKEGQQAEMLIHRIQAELATLAEEGVPAQHLLEYLDQLLAAEAETSDAAEQQRRQEAVFIAQGWQQTTNLISPEVEHQLHWPAEPNREVWVGPKYLYLMPQSSVHKGYQSVYVIVQPCYVPGQQRWLLLHDQHMAKFAWEDHGRLFQQLNPEFTTSARPGTAEYESELMQQCIELPAKYQDWQATATFLAVVYEGQSAQKHQLLKRQQAQWQLYQRLVETLPVHANYLLSAMDSISEVAEPGTAVWNEWMYQTMVKTLSTLFHQQTLTEEVAQQWLQDLARYLVAKPEQPWQQRIEHLLTSARVAPWLKLPGSSVLECTLFTLPSLMMKQIDVSALKAMTHADIIKLVGPERAKLWKRGTCQLCGVQTEVGECSVCAACDPTVLKPTGSLGRQQTPGVRPQPAAETAGESELHFRSGRTIGIGALVAGLLG